MLSYTFHRNAFTVVPANAAGPAKGQSCRSQSVTDTFAEPAATGAVLLGTADPRFYRGTAAL